MELAEIFLKLNASAWMLAAAAFVGWLLRDPLSLIVKARELRQKDIEISLQTLKEVQLSEDVRDVICEGIENYEFRKAAGFALKPHERGPVSKFVQAHSGDVRWVDFERALVHLKVEGHAVRVIITRLQSVAYWMGRLFTTFLLLIAAASLFTGMYTAFVQQSLQPVWLAYGFLYLLIATLTRVSWVLPHDSAKKIQRLLAKKDQDAEGQVEISAEATA